MTGVQLHIYSLCTITYSQAFSTHPFNSLYSMQPKENQSAEESYAVPLDNTSGAM